MIAKPRFGFHHFTIGLLLALSLLLLGGLLAAMQAQAGSRDARPTAQSAPAPGDSYVAGEVLVRLKAGASKPGRQALASALGAARVRDLRVQAILPRGQRILLFKSTTLSGEALVASALRNPNVISASLNYRHTIDEGDVAVIERRGFKAVTPDDPLFPDLWGLNNIGQTGGTPGADISAPEAWSTTTGSADVVVASTDTGVAYDHPDLAANMWHNPYEIPANGIDDDLNGYIDDVYGINAITGSGDPYDDQGHGSHTSGTMAAVGDNGIGITGVAWQARIMAVKFLDATGYGTTADAIASINYVVNEKVNYGVNVVAINASWGGGEYSVLERDSIRAAGAAGIVFCTSAGNDATNNDVTPQYPSSYDCPNIISVAATDDTDALADFSNYGATSVDLAAPGVSILSTVPAAGVSFLGVDFVDATQGWAVGEGGLILATSDGGATWNAQSSGTLATLWGVDFSDATHGWAVGDGGLILATSDGGDTWSAQSSGTFELLYDVAFSDATHGWAVGEADTILATSDGGDTWNEQRSGSGTWLHGVGFSDATHGWAVGFDPDLASGVILATTNGGDTWIEQSSGSSSRLYDVAFSDATHAWVVGGNGTILVTTNGGGAWTEQSTETTERIRSVAFSDATHGWAVGWYGTILATEDGGGTWTEQSSGTSADLEAVAFSDAENGWAVGGGGAILATTNGGDEWNAQTSLGSGGWYVSWMGTSMAAPHVTGAVALCAAEYPSETMTQRVQRILDNVDPLASLSGKTATGGRLNVAAAVDTTGAPAPTVFGFTPTLGPAGTVVTLFGTGFSGAIGPTSVAFNGVVTNSIVFSATRITAIVPRRATSGPISVTTAAGTGTSRTSFIVVR
ncbi:MAG: S8 family serine peptidase [Actinomycetes bacterium]